MLTAVVLTKNEGKNIERCVKSLSFCDEIVLVDDTSSDNTVQIATEHGATVYPHSLNGDFAKQRNYTMEKAKNDWVLFVDADEVVTKDLQKELSTINHQLSTVLAFRIRRRDFFWGKELKYGEVEKWRNRGAIRLVKKGSGSWVGKVHEEFKMFNAQCSMFNGFLDHYPHQTVMEFIESVNNYSTIRAEELHGQGKRFNILSTIAYPFGKFFYVYFLKRGFLDGPAGFAYAFFMSFHSFLSRAKLYHYV